MANLGGESKIKLRLDPEHEVPEAVKKAWDLPVLTFQSWRELHWSKRIEEVLRDMGVDTSGSTHVTEVVAYAFYRIEVLETKLKILESLGVKTCE